MLLRWVSNFFGFHGLHLKPHYVIFFGTLRFVEEQSFSGRPLVGHGVALDVFSRIGALISTLFLLISTSKY